MTFRLIALDIDGTIKLPGRPVSDRTARALERVRGLGAVVTIATGRSFLSAVDATAGLRLDSPIASFQGAQLADPRTGRVLWHRPLSEDMTLRALGSLNGWDGDVMAFVGNDVYVDTVTEWAAYYGERQGVTVHEVGPLEAVAGMRPTRLVVVGEEEPIERLESDLIGRFGDSLHITRSLPQFCEILHPSGGKHRALAALCGRLGISTADTLAFGNGYNDVHMLRWAGLGVAVEGAAAPAAEAADIVCASVEDEGPARVLEDLASEGLIG